MISIQRVAVQGNRLPPNIQKRNKKNNIRKVMSLSNRGQVLLDRDEFLYKHLRLCDDDAYDKVNNPEGYVNLGTADSFLCEDLLSEWLSRSDVFEVSRDEQHYFPMWGSLEVRVKVAEFLSHYFKAHKKIDPDNVILLNGGIACMEALSFSLFDAGDVLLTPTPAYTRIFADFSERLGVEVVAIPIPEQSDVEGVTFQLTTSIVEDAVVRERSRGKKVKGLLIVSPNNPLGDVYSPSLIQGLLQVCARHDLHYISDELYALSVHNDKSDFHSILRLHNLPLPEKTHFIWSFSKDMCFSGLRFGVIVTWSQDLISLCKMTAMYTGLPAAIHTMAAKLLSDREWLDNVFFPTNKARMRTSELAARNTLETLGVMVRPSKAGFFLWADFRRYMSATNAEGELELFRCFMRRKLYVVPGRELLTEEAGWFRIAFTVRPHVLDEGLRRLKEVLQNISS